MPDVLYCSGSVTSSMLDARLFFFVLDGDFLEEWPLPPLVGRDHLCSNGGVYGRRTWRLGVIACFVNGGRWHIFNRNPTLRSIEVGYQVRMMTSCAERACSQGVNPSRVVVPSPFMIVYFGWGFQGCHKKRPTATGFFFSRSNSSYSGLETQAS